MTPGKRLRAIVDEDVSAFLRELRQAAHGRDRSVHKARKLLQQLRSAVLLFERAQPALARSENAKLRALRRRLGPLRDEAARAETFRLLASRKRWTLWRSTLRQLAERQQERHAQAWAPRREDSPFWRLVLEHGEALQRRAAQWPCEDIDDKAVEHALARAGKRLRRALDAGIGHYGREARHDLRRRLRRYANLRRIVDSLREAEDEQTHRLLALAKKCGHEGDLWLAAQSAKRESAASPEYRDLAYDLDAHRRRMCQQHDSSLLAIQ